MSIIEGSPHMTVIQHGTCRSERTHIGKYMYCSINLGVFFLHSHHCSRGKPYSCHE